MTTWAVSDLEIVPKKKWLYPLAIEREYAKWLTLYVDKEMEIVNEFLQEMANSLYRNSIRTDAVGDWLGNLVDRVQRKVKQKLNALPVINRVFQQVNYHVSKQMTDTTESLFGNRPRQFNSTRELETIKTIWTAQNTTLIKSIDQQIMDKIRYSLSQQIIRTTDKEQVLQSLTKDIQEIAGVAHNRAVLIATDQVGKLNSQLTQYRQMNSGIMEYIWETMRDHKVRKHHAAREGRRFRWTDPPNDGHPGWAVRCRCTALPVYDTDKMGVEPKHGSFISAPDGPIEKDKFGSIVGKGTTKTMDSLFDAGLQGKVYVVDNSLDRPYGYQKSTRTVRINPNHSAFKEYDLREAISHETIHWLDKFMGWSQNQSSKIDKAIVDANKFILDKSNVKAYEGFMESTFANNMSISDMFSNITLNAVVGNVRHHNSYWLDAIYGPERRRMELLGSLLTVYTIGDESAEKLIRNIPPLDNLYKEFVRRYGAFLKRVNSSNKRS